MFAPIEELRDGFCLELDKSSQQATLLTNFLTNKHDLDCSTNRVKTPL